MKDPKRNSPKKPVFLVHYAQTQWRRFFGLNVSKINDHLYLGGQFTPLEWVELHKMGVQAVLNMRSEAEDQFFGTPPILSHRIPVDDYQAPSMDQLKEAVQFIQDCRDQNLPLLVHCKAGVGRSAVTVAAYFVSTGKSRVAAYDSLWRARPIIDLNTVQLARLIEWEWYVQNAHLLYSPNKL